MAFVRELRRMVWFPSQLIYKCLVNEIGHLTYCVEYILEERFLVLVFRLKGK